MITALKKYITSVSYKYRVFRNEKIVADSFLTWAGRHAHEGFGVVVKLRTQKRYFTMLGGKLVSASASGDRVQFVLATPKQTVGSVRGITPIVLFKTDLWSVYEYPTEERRSLRHGLNSIEREVALALVRNHVTQVLQGGETGHTPEGAQLLSTYSEPTTVDVMLWVKGEMRGSKIYTGSSLVEALCGGVVLSARDDRFKPLSPSELSQVRFEINILSDLQMPVITSEMKGLETTIQPQCGYIALCGNLRGWYLPVIYNVKKLASLAELLRSLAHDKTGIPVGLFSRVKFYAFPVEIFRESASLEKVIGMQGPLCVPEQSTLKLVDVATRTEQMASWLCGLTAQDGYLPLKADPHTKKAYVTDWARMAFAACALGVYGRAFGDDTSLRQAASTAAYIQSVYHTLNQSPSKQAIVSAYLGRLALVRGDYEIAKTVAATLRVFVEQTPSLSVIMGLQIASFFDEYSELGYGEGDLDTLRATGIIDRLFTTWKEELAAGKEVSFAEYAELLPLLYRRTLVRGSLGYELAAARYDTVRTWYQKHQLENGAFPNTTRSNYCYTRGTGKIWEALAIDPTNEEMCFKAAWYVLSLQYHSEAMFNIPPTITKLFAGALMHDEVNHEAWTDSVGHVLIAAARMLKHPAKAI